MELTAVQIAIARLAADAGLRARFADDPTVVAVELGLNANDATALSQLNIEGLNRFAATLDRKALKRLRHELPQLCRVLGEQLPELFVEFGRSPGKADHRAGSEISALFANHVAGRGDLVLRTREIARMERICVQLRRSWLPLKICRVHYRLDETRDCPPARPLLAIFVRLRGLIRIVYLPLRPAIQARNSIAT